MNSSLKSCFWCFILIAIILLTSCSDEQLMQETSEIKNDLHNLKSTTNKELIDMYTNCLIKKLETEDLFYPLGYDTFDVGLSSIIAFCDIDFDGTPELLAGQHDTRGHSNYSIYSNNGVVTNSVSCGICSTFISTKGSCYSNWTDLSDQCSYWVKLSTETPEIKVNVCSEEKNPSFDVTIISSNQEKNYNDVVYDDVDSIFKQEFGVSYTELQNSTDCNVDCVIGHLIVPDPENYTEEDIYNCLLALLQEYEDKVEE